MGQGIRRLYGAWMAGHRIDLVLELPPGIRILDIAAASAGMCHILPLRDYPGCLQHQLGYCDFAGGSAAAVSNAYAMAD